MLMCSWHVSQTKQNRTPKMLKTRLRCAGFVAVKFCWIVAFMSKMQYGWEDWLLMVLSSWKHGPVSFVCLIMTPFGNRLVVYWRRLCCTACESAGRMSNVTVKRNSLKVSTLFGAGTEFTEDETRLQHGRLKYLLHSIDRTRTCFVPTYNQIFPYREFVRHLKKKNLLQI